MYIAMVYDNLHHIDAWHSADIVKPSKELHIFYYHVIEVSVILCL